MRVGIGGLMHETHTFLPETTGVETFEVEATRGAALRSTYEGTNTALGGFLEVCADAGAEVVPTVYARGGISGTVEEAVYETYVGELCERLGEAGALDGVLLYLHGAMVTETRTDPETDVVRAVREVVGDVPVVVAMDLHGNVTEDLVREATAVCAYQSSPHVDKRETGRRAARLLRRTVRGEADPTTAIAKPGLVVPSAFSATTTPPARDVVARALTWQVKPELYDVTKWDRRADLLDVSVFFGFAWADVPQVGVSAVVVTDGDPDLAATVAEDVASFAWEARAGLTDPANCYDVEAGVDYALSRAREVDRPVLVLDAADRLAETTFVLRELLERDAERTMVPLLCDPAAVAACERAGEGNEVAVAVGSKTHPRGGGPVALAGTVEYLGDLAYTATGPMTAGLRKDYGRTAVVRDGGVTVQLTSRRSSLGLVDTDPIEQCGYDVTEFDVVVSKSKTHFRAVYEPLAAEIVVVDAPEYSPADLGQFDYETVPDGVYPITRRE